MDSCQAAMNTEVTICDLVSPRVGSDKQPYRCERYTDHGRSKTVAPFNQAPASFRRAPLNYKAVAVVADSA